MAIFIATKRFIERRHPDAGPSTYMARYFDFFPAINIEHKTERTGAFVTLVFGYSVVALLFQNRAEFGINAFFGKAVLGLIQAFSFNWLYFEIDACNLHTHAIRRHYLSAMAWMTLHLPFIMAYVLAGAALSRLVLATDCRDANVEDLTEMYVSKSEHEVSDGLRWFYCGGLGIALMSMSKDVSSPLFDAPFLHPDHPGYILLTNLISQRLHIPLPRPPYLLWPTPFQDRPPRHTPRRRCHSHLPPACQAARHPRRRARRPGEH